MTQAARNAIDLLGNIFRRTSRPAGCHSSWITPLLRSLSSLQKEPLGEGENGHAEYLKARLSLNEQPRGEHCLSFKLDLRGAAALCLSTLSFPETQL